MCGIAAIYSKKQSSRDLESLLKQISHRGEGKYFNESHNFEMCSIGMNRLAIVDRENAKQPITSNSGNLHIVLNGEIYNYKEIKAELEKLDYTFQTDSDTEVLVNGFQEYGPEILQKINGMYAFIVYNSDENTIFAARDIIGIKPLYFGEDEEGNTYFCSEIKGLASIDSIQEIKLFPPAHYMSNGQLTQYWSFPEMIEERSEQEEIKNLRNKFDETVRIRVDTDLPVAVYMSGGLDSSSILATARKYHEDVTAIIVGNEQSEDRKTAIRYCEENSVPYVLNEPPTEEELFADVEQTIKVCESFEPNLVRQSPLSRYIARTAKDFKVILCGEGADEIFAGYPEFKNLPSKKSIQSKIIDFLKDLHRTQLQRVDRTSMEVTTEVRVPFLDRNFLEYVLSIEDAKKLPESGGEKIEKYIFRKAMEDRLPEYIYNRKKVVLSEGAGYRGNEKGGLFEDLASAAVTDELFQATQSENPEWGIRTKEEAYYFNIFANFGYTKATFMQNRIVANSSASLKINNEMVQEIMEGFNTWHFKSEQPHLIEHMEKFIAEDIAKQEPVEFVMYWGKGDRDQTIEVEEQAKSVLEEMATRIKNVYEPGVLVNIIYTDTHALLNGYEKRGIEEYLKNLQNLFSEKHYKIHVMSEISNQPVSNEALPDGLSKKFIKLLKQGAQHHSKSTDLDEAARKYFFMNQTEKTDVAEQFFNAIFLTYNSSFYTPLLPDSLPIFFMYSTKKGNNTKPWFT